MAAELEPPMSLPGGSVQFLDGALPVTFELDPSLPEASQLGAPGNQRRVRLAANTKGYLAVWEDDRDGVPNIYGARITPTFPTSVAEPSFLIAAGPAFGPEVTFDGTQFLVAWSTGAEVQMARVKSDGSAADAVGLATLVVPATSARVSAIAGADPHLVVVTATDTASPKVTSLHAHLLIANQFTVIDLGGAYMPDGGSPGLAFCDGVYKLAIPPSGSGSGLQFPMLQPDTGALDFWSSALVSSTPGEGSRPTSASIACNPKKTLVAWRETNKPTIRARLIDSSDPSNFYEKELSSGSTPASGPRTSRFRDGFILAWTEVLLDETSSVRVLTADVDGLGFYAPSVSLNERLGVDVAGLTKFSPSPEMPAAIAAYEPSIASASDDDVSILGKDFKLKGTLGEFTVSNQPNEQRQVVVAPTKGGAITAWTDIRGATKTNQVTFVAVDESGEPTTGALPVVDSLKYPTTTSHDPAIASADGSWLLAWAQDGTAFVNGLAFLIRGIDAFGESRGWIESNSDYTYRKPAVAVTGDHFTIAYERGKLICPTTCTFVSTDLQVAYVPLAPESSMASKPVSVTGTGATANPTVAGTVGNDALVVWEHNGDLYGLRIAESAVELNAPLMPIAALPGIQQHPSLAFRKDAGEGLLVWQDVGKAGNRILAMRLDAEAKPLGSSVLVSQSLASDRPKVLVDGTKYWVTWEGSTAGGPTQVYAAAVRFDGSLADDVPLVVSQPLFDMAAADSDEQGLTASAPSVALLPSGGLLVVSEQVVPKLGVRRAVATKLANEVAAGNSCSAAAECESRHCVDAVCCATACVGQCQRCDGRASSASATPEEEPGTCRPVSSGGDDACADTETCAVDGTCKLADGQDCEVTGDCASGFCVNALTSDAKTQGICCDSECAGACDSCSGPTSFGRCATTECGKFACSIESQFGLAKQCLDSCEDSSECVRGAQCVLGDCVTPPTIEPMDVGCRVVARGGPRPSGAAPLLATIALGLARFRRRARASLRLAARAVLG